MGSGAGCSSICMQSGIPLWKTCLCYTRNFLAAVPFLLGAITRAISHCSALPIIFSSLFSSPALCICYAVLLFAHNNTHVACIITYPRLSRFSFLSSSPPSPPSSSPHFIPSPIHSPTLYLCISLFNPYCFILLGVLHAYTFIYSIYCSNGYSKHSNVFCYSKSPHNITTTTTIFSSHQSQQ